LGLTVGGYLSWGVAFLLLGVLLGTFVDHRFSYVKRSSEIARKLVTESQC